MPESPEVQALVDFLSERVTGRSLVGFDVVFPKALKAGDPSAAVGCLVTGVFRHGKLIDLVLAGGDDTPLHVVVHWGHDGWVEWHDVAPDDLKRIGAATLMARIRLDDELEPRGPGFDLVDSGPWAALSIFVVADPQTVPAIAKLGPDPVAPDFTRARLGTIVTGRRKQLKALLQDQAAVSGIGNAYSDEILHAARLSPVVHAATLSDDEIDRLYDAMRGILSTAFDARRGLAPELLKDDKRANMRVHRRPGALCPVCGDVVREFTFSGAAAHYCPSCQTQGAVLA